MFIKYGNKVYEYLFFSEVIIMERWLTLGVRHRLMMFKKLAKENICIVELNII
jgi:hypothetical protein